MALLFITEFAATYRDHAVGGGAAFQPPVVDQTPIANNGGSTQSAAFNAFTRLIRVHTDGICSIAIGANPTATTSNMRLATNSTEYFAVVPGQKLAVIANT